MSTRIQILTISLLSVVVLLGPVGGALAETTLNISITSPYIEYCPGEEIEHACAGRQRGAGTRQLNRQYEGCEDHQVFHGVFMGAHHAFCPHGPGPDVRLRIPQGRPDAVLRHSVDYVGDPEEGGHQQCGGQPEHVGG